ncbi:helitron_like_N domain-containing protein [Trichonephila clavipes]|nr:helitron_like_N domain-containing protein [Trichonephila clavipes]
MQIRRLRYEGNYGTVGQVINVPVDVNNIVQQLPRRIDDDFAFNVNIKKKRIHKSNYLSGFVRKSVIKAWLRHLVNQPLYKHYDIKIDWSVFDKDMNDYIGLQLQIESVDPDFAPESEILLARQHTLLWNKEQCLDIAPGQNSSPINIIYDVHGKELSFPQIYYGVPHQFDLNVRVTPYMIATSEIRHTDRRDATPDQVLYMAMKMLRIRVVEGIYNMFRCVKQTESITRKMLEDRNFMDECIDKNFVFLKSIPNSIQYWMTRKKDLFAMLRQLGKPTVFFTISANEIQWPKLLKILHGLSDSFKDIHVEDSLVNLNLSQRSHLVNEDPVTCCVYFNKLVDTIMAMLQAKMTCNPFGPYRVLDYFLRIEFQHRGSPHAHVLL